MSRGLEARAALRSPARATSSAAPSSKLIGDEDETRDGRRRLQLAVPRRPARLRAARPRARRVAAAVPAPRRGDARDRRRPAARDALPGAPGAVRRDRRASTRPSCSASTASTSSATTGPGASPGRSSATLDVRQCCVLKADVQGFAALMRAGARRPGPRRARGSGAPLGAAGGDHRDPRRRRGPDRRRRSGGAGADRAPPDGRGLPGAGPAAPADRAALRAGADRPARRRPAHDHRRRRCDPLRGAGRAAGRARPDLGDRGLPPAVPRAAVALADDGGARRRTAATASTSGSPARPSPTPGCVCTGSSPDRSGSPPRVPSGPRESVVFSRCSG